MSRKRKAKFNSLSTPNLKIDLSNYLVELAFLRSNRGIRLPAYYWRETKYKFRFKREIQAVRKFIKKYGESAVLKVSINNYIDSYTDYAKIEFLLQKIQEHKELLLKPKDISSVSKDFLPPKIDLRDNHESKKRNVGVFEKISEYEK